LCSDSLNHNPFGIGHSNLRTTNQTWIEKSTICARLWISWPLWIWDPKTQSHKVLKLNLRCAIQC
jgi:hypothetical protein